MPSSPAALTLRIGCELVYRTGGDTSALLMVRPGPWAECRVQGESLLLDPPQPPREEFDSHGNRVDRVLLHSGLTTIRHDALVQISSIPELELSNEPAVPPDQLPLSLLRYTLPSRYCDSDQLMDLARDQFGLCTSGAPTVRAILDWVHNNLEYRFGSGSPNMSASQALARGHGVCRDFAHAVVALCRTFNIPARYATGHLPDIAVWDNGTPMDFHAYAEVYLDGKWIAVDARFNQPRIGRITISRGMDAGECALSTFFGEAELVSFYVWNFQVDPAIVTLQDPMDITKRLDGTPQLVLPPVTEPFR